MLTPMQALHSMYVRNVRNLSALFISMVAGKAVYNVSLTLLHSSCPLITLFRSLDARWLALAPWAILLIRFTRDQVAT